MTSNTEVEGVLGGNIDSKENKKSLETLFSNKQCPQNTCLVDKMPDVLYQGDRKTCASLAAVSLLEYYFGGRYKLSSQFLYWIIKVNDGGEDKLNELLSKYNEIINNESDSEKTSDEKAKKSILEQIDATGGVASDFKVLKTVLEKYGTCLENSMPYTFSERIYSQGQGGFLTLEKSKSEALCYSVKDDIQIMSGNAVDTYRNRLSGSDGFLPMPVIFTIPIFPLTKLERNYRDRTGWFSMPKKGIATNAYHTMLAVGYIDSAMSDGGGYIIARNSWGENWGASLSDGKSGYAKISYAYISEYASESALTILAKTFATAGEALDEFDLKYTKIAESNMLNWQGEALDEFDLKYTKIAESDMLNWQGEAIISKGDKVIFDKENGLVDLYNPANKKIFKENGYSWQD